MISPQMFARCHQDIEDQLRQTPLDETDCQILEAEKNRRDRILFSLITLILALGAYLLWRVGHEWIAVAVAVLAGWAGFSAIGSYKKAIRL